MPAYRASRCDLNTCTFLRAITARRTRRMSSSLFPLNITPLITSIHPPVDGNGMSEIIVVGSVWWDGWDGRGADHGRARARGCRDRHDRAVDLRDGDAPRQPSPWSGAP